jgi:hypothetical protein
MHSFSSRSRSHPSSSRSNSITIRHRRQLCSAVLSARPWAVRPLRSVSFSASAACKKASTPPRRPGSITSSSRPVMPPVLGDPAPRRNE